MKLKLLKVLILALVLCAGCGDEQTAQKEDTSAADIVPVITIQATTGDISRQLEFVGNVQPWQHAALASQVSGKVEKMFVEVGDRVANGAMLIQMSDEQLVQSRANLVVLEKDWQRMKDLLEEGAVTQQSFDKVDAAYQAAGAGHEMLLANTQIRAPFAGQIAAKYYEEGEVFTPAPGRSGKTAILDLMDLNKLKIIISVSGKDLPDLRRGLDVLVAFDAYPGEEYAATVNRVEPTVDPNSRMGSVEIEMDNRERLIKPGMFARIKVVLEARRNVLIAPTECVISENGQAYVMLIDGSKAHRQSVRIGLQNGDITEVQEGLSIGDTVIRVGQRVVKDGQEVEVVPPYRNEGDSER